MQNFKEIAEENEEYSNNIEEYIPKSYVQNFGHTKKSLSKLIKEYDVENISIINGRTQDVMFQVGDYKNIVVLNFANNKNVGGGYLRGCYAQEEDLCRVFPKLYQSLGRTGKYPFKPPQVICSDLMDCTRDVETYNWLPESDWKQFYIVSAAAPNVKSKNDRFHEEIVTKTFDNILLAPIKRFKLKNPKDNCIILGAWGCGGFGNNPEIMAELMINEIEKYGGHYDKIVFAIPKSNKGRNYEIFKNIFDST